MATDTGSDNNEAMEFTSNSRKAGYNDDRVALARLSFGLPLLVVFGKESSKAGTRDSRILPGLEPAKAWDDGSQYMRLKNEAGAQLPESERILRTYCSDTGLSLEAQRLALECQIRAGQFVTGIFGWMSNSYQAGVANGRAPDPLWKYTSH